MFRTFGRFAAGIMAAFVGIIIVTFAIADDLNNPPTSGLTVESDPIFTASSNLFYRSSNPSNYVTASVTNGLLTSYSETDPAFVSASNLFLQVEADTVALQTGAVLQTQIDELANTTWQDAVIDVDLATPPVSPTTGDRYVVATGGTGAWATKDKNIAQYNGSGWDFTAPVLGMGVNETDSGNDYRYNGSVWTLLTGPAPAKSVSVQESDGSPAIAGATKIVVPNGSLTKSGTTATFNWLTSAVTSAVSTNLAAGLPTVVGSQLRIGTNTVSGITSLTNDASVAAGTIVGSGSVLGIGSLAGVSLNGYEATVGPSDIFGWYSGGSIASSNNAAPVYWSSTDANGDYLGIGFTTSDTLLQSRYAFAIPKIPSYASGWNSGTGMVVSVYTSDTGITTNAIDFRLTAPAGTQYSTNNLVSSSGGTLTHFYIPGTSLPGFSNNTATADWTIRFDFKCRAGTTAAVSRVKFQFQ